jgi:hypothetical protein
MENFGEKSLWEPLGFLEKIFENSGQKHKGVPGATSGSYILSSIRFSTKWKRFYAKITSPTCSPHKITPNMVILRKFRKIKFFHFKPCSMGVYMVSQNKGNIWKFLFLRIIFFFFFLLVRFYFVEHDGTRIIQKFDI